MTRYVIIGMGVTGISAALTLRKTEPAADIRFICDDLCRYYSRPGLAYYLTNEIPEKQLFPLDNNDWKKFGAKLVVGRAIRIDRQIHLVEVQNHAPVKYDRLLLATGAASLPIKVAGESLDGVVKLDDLEDTRRIITLARRSKTAVVVGGGVVAMEMVEGLLAQGVRVHYFLRGNRYWANVLDEAESRIIENHLISQGVILHCMTEISEIYGRNSRVRGVKTKQGETIKCGIVGICIGVRARMELAQAAGLATDRGILVNEYLQTNDPDIYAAGDVAQVFDLKTKRLVMDSLWMPGRIQGRTAALNMAGKRQAYQRKVDINVLRLAEMMVSIIGSIGSGRDEDLASVARGSSETWLQLPNSIAIESGNAINNVRLMVGERTLLGGLVLGDQKLSVPLQELIDKQTDITSIRSQLLRPGAQLGEIIMDFWSGCRERETSK